MIETMDTVYGNPSSMHPAGRLAHDALTNCKSRLARALGVDSNEIILTSSGTESDNLAILGLARAHRTHGAHVIVSAIEHKAVLAAASQLETEGFDVTYLPVDHTGQVKLGDLKTAIRPDTILVSIMYANNEIGTTQPIKDIVKVCRESQTNGVYPLVHTDACQAAGMLPVYPRELGVDALTLNSSKIYGPKGIGLLYLRAGLNISPLIIGGNQEAGRRAGTENIALTSGFATALEEAITSAENHAKAMWGLQDFFSTELKKTIPHIQFNGHPVDRLPNNIHVTLPDIEGESLVLMLSEVGICAATGSACSSHDLEPSHVLFAIGQDENLVHGSLRFTLGRDTNQEELRFTARKLGEICRQLTAITAATTAAYKRTKTTV